jgi:uroporphyrinogen-III synthase
VVYVSGNAVRFARDLCPPGAPSRAGLTAAVGRGTARELSAAGTPPDLVPEREDSEGLLETRALGEVAGKRVLIVRGQGGRPLLGAALRERGARVSYAEVYRRRLPAVDVSPLLARWDRDVQAVTTTSVEVLDNLSRLLGETGGPSLRATPLVVISERMERAAAVLGVRRVLRAAGADDRSLVQALCGLAGGPAP